jgi:hypothetical protein
MNTSFFLVNYKINQIDGIRKRAGDIFNVYIGMDMGRGMRRLEL